jgi:hypothetical protein
MQHHSPRFIAALTLAASLSIAVAHAADSAHPLVDATPEEAAAAVARAATRETRPGLFFKAEWKQTGKAGEHPLLPDSIGDPKLEFKPYVPAGQIVLNGAVSDEGNPVHLWTGLCTSPCALTLREKGHFADLSGLARLRWNLKMSGLHQIHPIIKLADGTWLLGDHADGTTRDYLISEISFADMHWIKLDIARVVTVGLMLDKVDLSKVDEIGFADLMPGSGHGFGGFAGVAQIEVYAKPVAR